nr:MAG TPA: hypothetical protein [Caudoviricetes sp.]
MQFLGRFEPIPTENRDFELFSVFNDALFLADFEPKGVANKNVY